MSRRLASTRRVWGLRAAVTIWVIDRLTKTLPRDLRTVFMGGIIAATREEYGPVESPYSRKEVDRG